MRRFAFAVLVLVTSVPLGVINFSVESNSGIDPLGQRIVSRLAEHAADRVLVRFRADASERAVGRTMMRSASGRELMEMMRFAASVRMRPFSMRSRTSLFTPLISPMIRCSPPNGGY